MDAAQSITVKFLQMIAGGEVGYLPLLDLHEKRHYPFRTDDLEKAAAFAIEASNQRHQIYVRANVQSDAAGSTAATVSAMTILTLDFDVTGPGHKTDSRLPKERSDIFRVLEMAGVPAPTELLSTGGGLLGVWALEEPFAIKNESNRARAKDLSRKFQSRIAQVAKEMDMHVDATFDLVRACRLPGTRNWKPAYGPMGASVELYR